MAAEIDVVDEVTIELSDVVQRVLALRLLALYQALDALQIQVLMKGQRW